MHKITFSVKSCAYFRYCLYVYRQREKSILHEKSKDLLNHMFMVATAKERLDFYRKHGVIVNANKDIIRKELKFCVVYEQHKISKDDIANSQINAEYRKALEN